jgi:hypothetical protein
MMGGLRLLSLVLITIAVVAAAPVRSTLAAGEEWYESDSPERRVDFNPPPIANWEPEVYTLINDRVRGRMSFVHYNFFADRGINASVILTTLGGYWMQYYSPRDNLDFFMNGWGLSYGNVSEFRSLDTDLGEFDYATFTSNEGVEKSCLAFTRLFNKRKEITGFYCRADTKPIDDDDISRVISSVVLIDG